VTVTNGSWSYTDGPYNVQVGNGYRHGEPGYGQPSATLSTSLSCPSSVRAGRTGSCTLTVSNSGSGTARDVTAAIDLPSGLQAENRGRNGSDYTISGNDATAQLRSIGAGQSSTVTVNFHASDSRSWNRDNTVEVTASAQSGNGYGYGSGTRQGLSAQSTAYVTVYPAGRRS
jgi:hypothetical protein